MSDIIVTISDQVANDVIRAIIFPLEFNIPGKSTFAKSSFDEPPIGDAEVLSIEPEGVRESDTPLLSELGELYEEAIADALERDARGMLDPEHLTPEEKKLLSLLQGSLEDGKVQLSNKAQGEHSKLDKAITELVTKGLIDFAILWAQLRIVDRPNIDLGNPIRLSGLSTRSRAKAEACIKIFGKRVCARVTSPWIRVDGEVVVLHFETSGSKVSVRPRFRNLDFVITIRIFGKTFKIKIGLTTLVNRYFDGLPPFEVADLSVFEQAIPFSDKATRIKSVAVTDDPNGVRLTAQTEVV